MGEVCPRDDDDPTAARRDRFADRVEEPGHPWIVLRAPPFRERLMGEARENWGDREIPAALVEITEEDRLEFDRVLAAMRQLRGETVLAGSACDGLDELAVDRGGSERGRVILARERE